MPPEAMQQVMGFGLFAGLAVGLEDKGMELLAFAHDIVINSGEDGNGFGVERLLFLPRRHGQPLGVEQHFGQGGWPFLSGQLLHIDQFAQQVGIAQRMHAIVEFPIRRPAIVHQHAKSFGQDAMRGHGVHAALFVQAIPGQRGGGGHMQPMQFWWHPAMMDYPPCVYNSFLVDSLRLNSYLFSNSDMSWAEKENVPSYLGTPDGLIIKYTPIPGALPRSGPVVIIGRGAK